MTSCRKCGREVRMGGAPNTLGALGSASRSSELNERRCHQHRLTQRSRATRPGAEGAEPDQAGCSAIAHQLRRRCSPRALEGHPPTILAASEVVQQLPTNGCETQESARCRTSPADSSHCSIDAGQIGPTLGEIRSKPVKFGRSLADRGPNQQSIGQIRHQIRKFDSIGSTLAGSTSSGRQHKAGSASSSKQRIVGGQEYAASSRPVEW